MKTLMRILICGVLLSILSGAWMSEAQDDCAPANGEPIILGAVFPGSTMFSVRASTSLLGAEAMRQAVNACGGVDGRPVEWLLEPATDRSRAEAAVRRLLDAGAPLILGSGLPAVSEGARPAVESAGAVYWEATEALDSSQGWAFSPRPNDYQLGQATARFVETLVRESLDKDALRVALVYESGKRGRTIAGGVIDGLSAAPQILHSYTNDLYGSYRLGDQIRDQRIDVVIFGGFDDDGESLWYGLREADANIGAWIHVGSEGYRQDLCEQAVSTQAFLSVTPAAPVKPAYREEQIGMVYNRYREIYLKANGELPDETADLSASGVYLLLRYVLPAADGDYSADAIRAAALAVDAPDGVGLMGEGLKFDPATGLNQRAAALARQQQGTRFCTVYPNGVSTCGGTGEILPFPTWRERAMSEEAGLFCGSSA